MARLLFVTPAFQMFGIITFDILPAASSVFMILLFVGYIFASVGMSLYGGCKFSILAYLCSFFLSSYIRLVSILTFLLLLSVS